MKAIVVSAFGGPDVLHQSEVDEPALIAGHVLVDHEFVGVNYVDTQHRSGHPYPVELPLIVGIEASGTVVEVGTDVDGIATGDRVVYGGVMPGVYAERAVVPADQMVHVPDDIGSDVAAASLVQGWTAHMLAEHLNAHRRAPWVEDDQTAAVVFAAAGGTGSLLVQMLVAAGTRVFGVTSNPAKAEYVAALGAEPINRRETNPTKMVVAATNGGADIVFEGVGGPAFDQARRMLHPRGHLVSFGQSAGPVPEIDPAVLSGITAENGPGSLTLSWPTLNDHNATAERRRWRAKEVFSLIRDGRLEIRVHDVLPLSQADKAHLILESGASIGKLLLDAGS